MISRISRKPVHPSADLRTWAIRRGITINEVAQLMGLTPAGLSPMLNMKRRWSDPFIERVSCLTAVPAETILKQQYYYERWKRLQLGDE